MEYLDEQLFRFQQADITTVKLVKPADLITSFFVLQYLDDPLGAFVNLFNQLNRDGEILAHLLIPYSPKLMFIYQRFVSDLRAQGIQIDLYEEAETWVVGNESNTRQHLVFHARREGQTITINPELIRNKVVSDVNILVPHDETFSIKKVMYSRPPAGQKYALVEDQAQEPSLERKDVDGGIDFNADRLDLQRTGQRSDLDWGISSADLENIQISGLVPVIIGITPVKDLPALLIASP